jgi:hypothetical protein
MQYSIMAVDVGITTGYAIMRQDTFIERVGQIEYADNDHLMRVLYSNAYVHKVDQVVIEYPVLTKKSNNYAQLKHICSNVDDFVMNFKDAQTWGAIVTEITPGQWKIPPVLNTDLLQFPRNGKFEVDDMSQHEKDSLMICYYVFKWSLNG